MEGGRAFDIHPAGMLALDVARIEAGLLLIEVDFFNSKKALIESQNYSPYELGLSRLVHLDKNRFIGQAALRRENVRGPKRQIVGLEVSWTEVEELYDKVGLPPQIPAAASRVPVPVYSGGHHVGKATSTTWSPILKRMIALATVGSEHSKPGSRLQVELTVEAVRHKVTATVANTPFFNPPRKMATPPG